MLTFDQGDVVRVPFPYTDRPIKQHRPALVVSLGGTGVNGRLLWILMMTSAENRRWPGDIDLGERYADSGLPAPSVIRTAKIATIESAHAGRIGRLGDDLLRLVLQEMSAIIHY